MENKQKNSVIAHLFYSSIVYYIETSIIVLNTLLLTIQHHSRGIITSYSIEGIRIYN